MHTSQDKNNQPGSRPDESSTPIRMQRDFNVPVESLFAAFKTPEAIKAWWWPNGMHSDRVDYDFRENGKYFINMKGFDKGGGGMTGEFEEIIENERIVMTDYFADENGKAISAAEAKMPGAWPEYVSVVFDFEPLGDNKSRLELMQEGIPEEMKEDCKKGWGEMFDKLSRYLEKH